MTLWEILKANKTGIAPDMFTMLAASKMNSGRDRLHELSGTPPLSFTSKGKPLTAWSITGNTVQNGTPTPDNPIMPQGTGDLETVGAKAGQYKIPISSANTTTPVYLGEVESTRHIKKLVLTGDEKWNSQSVRGGYRFVLLIQNAIVSDTSQVNSVCSHFPLLETGGTYIKALGYTITNSSIYLRYDPIETTADFKSYLAAQYAAGTPVTVWYVLATEETAVVNEPLMKIGEYADTLSMEQAGVQIPTLNGTTVIDVDTAVKPESMTIKYRR